MSAVDHAAEARRIVADGEAAVGKLREAHEKGNYLIADEYGKKAMGCWAQAQVHATLALVEQQRIANLIALASLRVDPLDFPPLRHLAIEPRDEHSVQPVATIREGLGLA
ncbi:hypothetical protein [Agromyces sp. NBRC 114283]|uniref:hypothetical protein n=1 Tax=Agromyces sp. NBRC 114283 TaxID=2994521 RepID=UPI0024A4A029|nr:hypothetical protein [Agromyces sp. NBRC 114283]GLU91311.1 hypothetical protein Agsp01_35660 [Agromyces sp. NBRC 114283]